MKIPKELIASLLLLLVICYIYYAVGFTLQTGTITFPKNHAFLYLIILGTLQIIGFKSKNNGWTFVWLSAIIYFGITAAVLIFLSN
jgi:hypothetical protein